MADPVSWLLIEPGWAVVDANGDDVGRVEAVTGDSNADIFDGLAIASGMFARPKYVPAEQVAGITQGTVQLALDKASIDGLAEYDDPPESVEVDPGKASILQRAEERLIDRGPHEHRVSLTRRIATWFGRAGRR